MAKRMLIMLAFVIVIFGGVFGWYAFRQSMMKKYFANMKQPPATVSAQEAQSITWHPSLKTVGSVAAIEGVTVSSEYAGTISEILFKSGETVKKGAVLIRQDTQVDEATLKGLEARLKLAKTEYDRAIELRKQNTNSQADLDSAEGAYKQAQADVLKQKVLIEKKTVRAPFSGRLGIRQVDLGQYLKDGAAIVSLESIDPIFVNFNLPEQDYTQVKIGQKITITVAAYSGKTFAGKITAIDPKVDDSTRNFTVQATLQNDADQLHPGMFARVAVELPNEENTVTLPETAISYNPYGDSVYIVESPKNGNGPKTVRQQFVKTGATRGDQIAIISGVKPGDMVVTAGQLKLRNGSSVTINNKITPSDNPAPTPSDS